MRRINRRLGQAIAALESSDDRLHDMIYLCWREVMGQPEQTVLNELLAASLHDNELADALREVWSFGFAILGNGAEQYLLARTKSDDPRQLMVLSQWLLRGMSQDRHLVNNPEVLDHYLRLWSQLLATHLRAKPSTERKPAT